MVGIGQSAQKILLVLKSLAQMSEADTSKAMRDAYSQKPKIILTSEQLTSKAKRNSRLMLALIVVGGALLLGMLVLLLFGKRIFKKPSA